MISRVESAINPGSVRSIRNLMPSFKSTENRITYPPTCRIAADASARLSSRSFRNERFGAAEANCEAEREMDFMPGPLEQVTDFLPRTDGNFAGNRGCGLWNRKRCVSDSKIRKRVKKLMHTGDARDSNKMVLVFPGRCNAERIT